MAEPFSPAAACTSAETPHEKKAAELFLGGCACAQAVFCAFCDVHGLDLHTAALLSSSLGAGVGRLRQICGAVSGASMVLGLLYGFGIPVTQEDKTEHYARVQELAGAFRERMGSYVCRELLADTLGDENVSDSPAPQARTPEYYASRPCLAAVRTAARLTDEYIASHPYHTEGNKQ